MKTDISQSLYKTSCQRDEYRNHNKRFSKYLKLFFIYFALCLLAIICAGPFFWLFISSLRTGTNIYKLHFDIASLTFDNYIGVIQYMNLEKYILNTVVITFGAIVVDIIFSSLCAYPLAVMNFRGKKIVISILISTMIIPAAAGMIINYLTISKLHLLNTFTAIILTSSVKAFSIVLFRQAYISVHKEMIDAAKVDGAGEMRTWFNIMLPSIVPCISTVVIFDFIGNWNSFLWPIIILQDPDKYPLATALQYLNGSFGYKFTYVAAGTIISIIPVLIVFVLCQKNYIEAVSGAIKA